MSTYWIQTENDNALHAMAAVEKALGEHNTGEPPAPIVAPAGSSTASETPLASEPSVGDVTGGDPYLAENLAQLHATWAVDPNRIVHSSQPKLAWAINRFQKLARRATWWYMLPQWLQANEFHGAVVRVLDSFLAHQRDLRRRVTALENPPFVDRTQQMVDRANALEDQIRALRSEQQAVLRRVIELESLTAEQRAPTRTNTRSTKTAADPKPAAPAKPERTKRGKQTND